MPTANPFNPGKPVDPRFFGGRHKELNLFKEYLGYTESANPHHLAIMGERGIGKSSLLRKCEDIAREDGCITVRRELDATVRSIQELMLFMVKTLKSDGSSNLPAKIRAANKVKSFFSSHKVGVSVLGMGGSIEKIAAAPTLQDDFFNELMTISNGISEDVRAIVFLLDEAEKLQMIEGAWSFLRSLFTRVSERGGKYMIVVSGKLGLFKGIKEIFSPVERFLTPVNIEEMTLEETGEALRKPIEASSRTITSGAIRTVFDSSNGHPYVVQIFGFYAYEAGVKHIDESVIHQTLPRVMTRLSAQLFKDRYEAASESERRVLLTLSELRGVSRISDIEKASGMSEKVVPQLLIRLIEKECVKKMGRGMYALFNPLFGEYIKGISERS